MGQRGQRGVEGTGSPGCPSIGVEVVYCLAKEICPTMKKERDIATGSPLRNMDWLQISMTGGFLGEKDWGTEVEENGREEGDTSTPSGPPPCGRVVSFNAVRTLKGTIGYNRRTSQVRQKGREDGGKKTRDIPSFKQDCMYFMLFRSS